MRTEENLKRIAEETQKRAKQLEGAIGDKATFLAAGTVLFLLDEIDRAITYLARVRRALRYPKPIEPRSPKAKVKTMDLRDLWLEDMRRREIARLRKENRRILKKAGGETEEFHKNEDMIEMLKEYS